MRNTFCAVIATASLLHVGLASAEEIVATYEPAPNDSALDLGI